jgi:hypothetical protein
LNPLRENQKKLKSTIGMEREKIGAIAVLVCFYFVLIPSMDISYYLELIKVTIKLPFNISLCLPFLWDHPLTFFIYNTVIAVAST